MSSCLLSSDIQAAGHVYKMEFANSTGRSSILSGILKRRAFALYKIGRYDDALSDLNIAIRLITRINEPGMHLLATDIQLAMKDYDGALKSSQEAFKISAKGRTAAKRGLTDVEVDIVHGIDQLVGKVEGYRGVRADPVQHLSLDVIELVMQHGLAGDDYFALKCTWVTRSWRQTLQSIPSLWHVYTYNAGATRTALPKRQAWAKHAGNHFREIRLLHVDTKTAMNKINNSWKPYLRSMQTLKLEGTTMNHPDVVQHFAQLHAKTYNVESLHLHSFNRQSFRYNQLDLGLLTSENRATIQELHLEGISFEPYESLVDGADVSGWTALRYLSLNQCLILPFRKKVASGDAKDVEHLVQQDHLHSVLRRALNLEKLEVALNVLMISSSYSYPTTFSREMVVLERLVTLRIPPPCFWSIDIVTPNVRHLTFTFGHNPIRTRFPQQDRSPQSGLVPLLTLFAPTGIDVGKLVSVELMINGGDTKDNLLEWLVGMKNVERMTFVSVKLSSGTSS
ncbi:hypothetical protein QFC22_001192 [Naganishia vaughanmartiniae]|uniref:Uncharacterized protein n=1 Tax=Naganishia vaughanmartiniae TaxID=1424756 RepID=A0ACC2XMB1_9TREE|nr:hypothetical protein QFC22_001192 [Naganishia vaughanmartiniae]